MTSAMPRRWARDNPSPDYDIKRLRPASLRRGERFETPADARRYSLINESKIQAAPGLENLTRALRACREEGEPCFVPYCPICARRYRRWLIGQTLPFFFGIEVPAFFVTILLEECGVGDLHKIDVERSRRRLRTRMHRTLLPGAILVGGIEVGLKDERWLIHAHLACLGPAEAELRRLAGSHERSRALDIRQLRDVVRQVSYLQKFSTFHRPGQQTGSGRSRAYPLPAARSRELAAWMSDHEFEDFLFLYGARRRGSRIVAQGL
jgi:hypothetical protein